MRWRRKGRSEMSSYVTTNYWPDADTDTGTDTDTDPMIRLVECLDEAEKVLHGPLQEALSSLARQISEWE